MADVQYVIGLDYGTDSVRSLIVDAATGEEVSSAVYYYERWKEGQYCDSAANQFRQHPEDYLTGLRSTIREALAQAPVGAAANVKGISIDTTGSTPVAVDRDGTPLALLDDFRENPNAMFVLWKDHTAVAEADEITNFSHTWGGEDYTKYSGGIYSSEWFWAKILHILRNDAAVRDAAYSWVEHCDWMPGVLTGNTDPLVMKRSRCAAGHKALWHASWNGLPGEEFLSRLDPRLSGLRDRLYSDTCTADTAVGTLTPEWAAELGLSEDVVVGSGAFDAHMGAVGGEVKPYTLAKIMGTSTCDMLVAPPEDVGDRLIPGICGQVDGSIIPGMIGLEAGQSAFGDVYAWFKKLLMWPVETVMQGDEHFVAATREQIIADISDRIIPELTRQAEALDIGEAGLIALDWINGRRTPDANQSLTGAIAGLKMGSDAPRLYRALVEATAFGSLKINDRFRDEGVRIDGIIAMGGVAKKNPFIMQTVADILDRDIKVVRSEQACALGAAMFAAIVSGIYADTAEAQGAMGSGFETAYRPNPANTEKYRELYEKYSALGGFVEKELTA